MLACVGTASVKVFTTEGLALIIVVIHIGALQRRGILNERQHLAGVVERVSELGLVGRFRARGEAWHVRVTESTGVEASFRFCVTYPVALLLLSILRTKVILQTAECCLRQEDL